MQTETALILAAIAAGSAISAITTTAAACAINGWRGASRYSALVMCAAAFLGSGAGLVDGLVLAFLCHASPLAVALLTPLVAPLGLAATALFFWGLGVAIMRIARLGEHLGNAFNGSFGRVRGLDNKGLASEPRANETPVATATAQDDQPVQFTLDLWPASSSAKPEASGKAGFSMTADASEATAAEASRPLIDAQISIGLSLRVR